MTESDSSSASTLVKTDSLGRMRTSPERREMLLREFERSGMSGAAFAAMIGIKYQTFAGWRRSRAVARVPAKAPLRLVEAVVDVKSNTTRSEDNLIIHLPGGVRMELSDIRQVPLAGALLQSLQATGSPC
jgi:DNA-binding transcriptional regulator YiaG